MFSHRESLSNAQVVRPNAHIQQTRWGDPRRHRLGEGWLGTLGTLGTLATSASLNCAQFCAYQHPPPLAMS
jgi:hypothetical protein